MAGWVKTSHFLPDTWPQEAGHYWIAIRECGRREVFFVYWNPGKGAFQLFAERVDIIPWGFVTHYQPAEVPALPQEVR